MRRGAGGTARSYFTVLQAVPGFTLQPILAGRYHDEFEHVDGEWRFTDRLILPDLIGDLSHHMAIRRLGLIVRFGVVVPSYGRFGEPGAVRRLVATVESLGYESAWFADHVAIPGYAVGWVPPPQLEPLVACSVGLGATERLRFGVDVLVAAYRHPLLLASMAASADQLGGGRLTLGIGVGYLEGEFAALGVPYADRGAITDETLAILRAAWTEPGPLSYAGRHFSFDDVHVGTRCRQPGGVPLWVGGNAPRALRRAATLGDGWHPLWPSPEEYTRDRAVIESLRSEAGIDRPFTFSYSCPRGAVLASPFRGDRRPAPQGSPSRPEYGYVPPVPRAPDGGRRFTGTVEELLDDVEACARAGVEHLALRFWTSASDLTEDGLVEQLTRFATEVMPGAGTNR